jgi:DNA repair exonuclease SbcCD ATPase subunit
VDFEDLQTRLKS